jgi:antagonist of KipI
MTVRESPHIAVVKPGWFTTVQDLGRYGYQQYGVPVSGAMDQFACTVANRLVGNPDNAAVLEVTLKGPELLFERETVVCITGADLSPSVNGIAVPLWKSFIVRSGNRLVFGARRAGSRGYVAIAGGVNVPLVLGSRSTHIYSGIGGFNGRPLAQGDILLIGRSFPHAGRSIGRQLPERLRPVYGKVATLRLIPGPQRSYFQESVFNVLTASTYSVSPQSNRMGYRLVGPRLALADTAHFISDCTATGALQVPADGQPILLMADRQTTGGYPKIGVVHSVDLHLAAQLAPGDTVEFRTITLGEAYEGLARRRLELDGAIPPYRDPSV